MKATVTGEFYRTVTYDNKTNKPIVIEIYEKYSRDMYYDAFLYAGEHKKSVSVERVTKWECESDNSFEFIMTCGLVEDGSNIATGETVTATYRIEPPHFANDDLSRYNPVNGWSLPKQIDI